MRLEKAAQGKGLLTVKYRSIIAGIEWNQENFIFLLRLENGKSSKFQGTSLRGLDY